MDFSKNNSSGPEIPNNGLDTDSIIIVMVLLAFEGFLAVVINAWVIILIVRRRFLQTVTNLCLGSLALSDMLTGLYVIPLIISCNYPTYSFGVCLAMDLGNRFLAISTILHLLVITMERYYTIVFSKSSSGSSLSITTSLWMLTSLWIFSLVASLIQLFWVLRFQHEELTHKITVIYDLIVLGVLVLLPVVLMAIAYTHIFCVLRKQVLKIKRSIRYICEQTTVKHNRKEKKALLIYGAMIIVFITGWFNYFLLTLKEDLAPDEPSPSTPFWASMVLLFLRQSTGIFNPILYTFLKKDFRIARKSFNFFCFTRKNYESKNGYSRSEASFGFSSAFYKKGIDSIGFLS